MTTQDRLAVEQIRTAKRHYGQLSTHANYGFIGPYCNAHTADGAILNVNSHEANCAVVTVIRRIDKDPLP